MTTFIRQFKVDTALVERQTHMPPPLDEFQTEKQPSPWLPSPSSLNLVRQRRIFNRKRTRTVILIVGCILIILWQFLFLVNNPKLDKNYQITDITGLQFWTYPRFFYFYFYLGLFPVATENHKNLVYSKEGAEREIAEHGNSLLMEVGHCIRSGDYGKIFLYFPDAFLRGNIDNPDVRLFNSFLFILALIGLFISFWWIRQPLLGIITVVLLGSNPFQLYEVYTNENIFGWIISTAIIILAIHLPLLTDRKRSPCYLWAVPILTGIILGTTLQIRAETMAIIVSALLSYLLISKTGWRIRISMALLLVLFYPMTTYAWKNYFDYKFKEASRIVKEAGGHPFPEKAYFRHHPVWHNFWCGLGDFDEKYGYVWDDGVADDYAFPILKKKYKMNIRRRPDSLLGTYGRLLDTYWDKDKKYYMMVEHLPNYFDVLRDKVIHDITNDPLWYFSIICKRVWRAVSETTPVRISLGSWWITLPVHGLLLIPTVLILIAIRNWMLLKLVCFTLPLASATIIMYSGSGMSLYSCFHIFTAAICVAWLVEGGLWWYKKRVPPSQALTDTKLHSHRYYIW